MEENRWRRRRKKKKRRRENLHRSPALKPCWEVDEAYRRRDGETSDDRIFETKSKHFQKKEKKEQEEKKRASDEKKKMKREDEKKKKKPKKKEDAGSQGERTPFSCEEERKKFLGRCAKAGGKEKTLDFSRERRRRKMMMVDKETKKKGEKTRIKMLELTYWERESVRRKKEKTCSTCATHLSFKMA